MICAPEPEFPREAWRTSFLHSPETFHVQNAPLRPLLVKELWEILSGRALWTMLLLMCPLLGYSFLQATSLYGEASVAGLRSPVLASSLSPLDGVLVPTLGASYVAVTLLFPFVAIRVLGLEKESGALRLLVQLPYRPPALIAAKLAAVLAALVLSSIPAVSALVIWGMQGGHLSAPETLNLLFGHLLYGLLVGAIALFAASVSESAATAAIVTLAFTIGSWVLDFTVAGQPGFLAWIARLSLTQILRTFEQGLLSAGLVLVSARRCSVSPRWQTFGCRRGFKSATKSFARSRGLLSWRSCSASQRRSNSRSTSPKIDATLFPQPTSTCSHLWPSPWS